MLTFALSALTQGRDPVKTFFALLLLVLVTACSHPLEIVGEGDILSASGNRTCLLEDYRAGLDNCSKNYAIGAYEETYYAVPRAGWQFDHWANYCTNATSNECSFNIPAPTVQKVWGKTVPPLQAVFTTNSCEGALPNVVFVLDNTSNWSRQSQKWPGGLVQGQSEVIAIKEALADKVGKLNVGLVEYSTGGSTADNDGGYVRFNLQELTLTSQAVLNQTLDTIYNNINGLTERRSTGNLYGYLPYDYYNYLSGSTQSKGGAGTPVALADTNAYTALWNEFRSPLGAEDTCADTNVIFIGNNTNGIVALDDTTNSTALKAMYAAAGAIAPDALMGDVGTPLAMPEFACTAGPDVLITPAYISPAYCDQDTVVPGTSYPAQTDKNLGTSAACWKLSEAAACTSAEHLTGGECEVSYNPPNGPIPTVGTCSCAAAINSATAGCVTAGSIANRTFHLNVVGDIPAYTEPDTVIPGQCYPETYHPAVYGPGPTTCAATGQVNSTGGLNYNFDDWAKFLHNDGIPLTITVDGNTYSERVKVNTYTIDVFNLQQSPDLSSLFFSAAHAGGGRYFQAKSEQEIIDAINSAIEDLLATGPDSIMVDGREWAQSDLFDGVSWSQINTVCPAGVCAGVLNGKDMTGWIWASTYEVQSLLENYADPESDYCESGVANMIQDGWRPRSSNISYYPTYLFHGFIGWDSGSMNSGFLYLQDPTVNAGAITCVILVIDPEIDPATVPMDGIFRSGGWFYRIQ